MSNVEQAVATMIANFPEKTGKPLDAWVKIARDSGLTKHGAIVTMLKSKHGMGHGFANMVAQTALKGDGPEATGEDLVSAQFAGAKAGLRPIYDALVAAIQKFGGDVELAPKKAYVSVRRSKQFAILQPSTAARFDVGINLKGEKATARLENSGSFNSMVSHRVRLENVSQVDKELLSWLKKAYEVA